MMKNYLLFNSSGELLQQGTTDYDFPDPGAGFVVETKDLVDLLTTKVWYEDGEIKTSELVIPPERPSPFHTYDPETNSWYLDESGAWWMVRSQRDFLLAQSDWTQLPDVAITTKEAWANYRQALRDITTQQDPFNIIWPTLPT